ncbi:MAG: hypothetical protein V4726_11460 [Verrucomicrobiota bacterium]
MSQPSSPPAAGFSPPASPFVGLVPFDDKSAAYFHGRDLEIQLSITNLLANRLTVLHGVSAVGKTSLILAGVLPRLRRAEEHNAQRPAAPVRILYQREWSGSMPALLTRFRTLRQLPETAPDIFDFPDDHQTLLILDQFEEFFRYQTAPLAPRTFLPLLVQALQSHRRLHILISLRDDALAQLDVLKTALPGLFDNMLRIEHLDPGGARQAIRDPLRQWTEKHGGGQHVWEAEDALIDNLLDQTRVGSQSISSLRGGIQTAGQTVDRVEVAYLQLCLEKLWTLHLADWSRQPPAEAPPAIHRLTNDRFKKAGGATGIIKDHILDRIALLQEVERDLFAAMTRQLITPELQKYAHSVQNLTLNAREGGFDFKESDLTRIPDLLKTLSAPHTRLLREITDAGGGPLKYEIFHDLLAKGLVGWRDKIVGERQGRQKQKDAWKRLALIGSSVAAIACTGFAYLAEVNRKKAVRAHENAETKRREAVVANESAEVARSAERDADKAREESLKAERIQKDRDQASETLRIKEENSALRTELNALKAKTKDAAITEGIEKVIQKFDNPLLHRLAGSSQTIRAAAYSPDGRYIALGSADERLRLYPRLGGTVLAEGTASSTPGGVTALAFSPDGAFLLTGSAGGSLRLFDPRLKALGQGKNLPGTLNTVTSLGFSSDGRRSVATDIDGEVALLDWSKYPKQLPQGTSVFQHGSLVSHAAFSADGQRLVISGDEPEGKPNWIRVLQINAGSLAELSVKFGGSPIVPEKIKDPTRRLRFSPIDSNLIIGGAGRTLLSVSLLGDRITYIRDSAAAGPYFHASGGVVDTVFSPDGKRAATIGTDGQCILWDAATARSLARIPTRLHGRLLSVGWQIIQGKSLLALGGEDGRLELWDLSGPGLPDESAKPAFNVQAHAGPVVGLRFDPLNEQLLTWDGSVNANTPSRTDGSPAGLSWKVWQTDPKRAEAAAIPPNQPAVWSLPNALRQGSAP